MARRSGRRHILVVLALIASAEVAWAGPPNVKKLAEGCQKGKAKDCAELTSLARTDFSLGVREEAAPYVTDPAVLAELALQDSWHGVRLIAVKKVDDPAVLAEVVKKDRDAGVRGAALERLSDARLLGDIVRTHEDPKVRAAALARISAPAILEALFAAKEVPSDLKRAALGALQDQEALARIGGSLNLVNAVLFAPLVAERLTDQKLLAGLARTAAQDPMRRAARARVTDQAVLAELAKADTGTLESRHDVAKLSDPALLADVATTAQSAETRLVALRKVRDTAVLSRAAKDSDPKVRAFAAARLAAIKANAVVAGALVESSLGLPAAGITVSLSDSGLIPLAEVKTDGEGRFTFAGVEPGQWTVYHGWSPLKTKDGELNVTVPRTGRADLGTLMVRDDELVTAALGSTCSGSSAARPPAAGLLFFTGGDGKWRHSYADLSKLKASPPWKAVLCVKEESGVAGHYFDKTTGQYAGEARASHWEVTLVRLDNGQTFAKSFKSEPPKEVQSFMGSASAWADPAAQVDEWLKTLN